MRTALITALLLAISVLRPARAETPLTARMETIPAHSLPAIPVVFAVTVTNSGVTAQDFYPNARLTATRADGTSFDVLWDGRDDREDVDLAHEMVIAAGASVKIYVPVDPMLLGNSAFLDSRICAPGTYDLQLRFAGGSLKTNVARLTVDTPTGADLAFWNALLDTTDDNLWNAGRWLDGPAATLVEQYPSSAYYNLLAFHRVHQEGVEPIVSSLKGALAAGVSGPIGDEFRLQVAFSLGSLAEDAARHGDFSSVASRLADANAILQPTLDHPSSDYALDKANLQKRQLQSRATIITNLQQHAPYVAPKALKVELKCRERDGRIRLNVQNVNTRPTFLERGTANNFGPAPQDRGQPLLFAPGKSTFSVSVLPGETSLTWTLDGTATTFPTDANSVKGCVDTAGLTSDR
jgi:hypothetical protein